MKIYIFIVGLTLSLGSCKKTFFKEEVNDPENNFELLWNDFDQHYGIFIARNWDWDSIYTVYRPQVTAQTTNTELWTIFTEMIEYLDDSHTYIVDLENETGFNSGASMDSLVELEFSESLLKSKYIENVVHFAGDENDIHEDGYFYGKIKNKDIGYIYLQNIEFENVGTEVIDEVLENIGNHKAIVIDIRNNGGGDDITASEIAGRFADGEDFIYSVQEKNGPKQDDFGEKIKYYTKKIGKQHFDKPVILLTDHITISAADIFCLHMKSFEKTTQIGTATAGDYSDVSPLRFLPNGWLYGYSTMMYLMPDGSTQDGIGSVPDIYIRNTVADIEASNDKVIEKAIDYLFTEYGIE